jgi:hypothetical protein
VPWLLDEIGAGPISAAQLLCSWSHPGRLRNDGAFAMLGGAAPIPASSGHTVRYRPRHPADRRHHGVSPPAAIRRLFSRSRALWNVRTSAALFHAVIWSRRNAGDEVGELRMPVGPPRVSVPFRQAEGVEIACTVFARSWAMVKGITDAVWAFQLRRLGSS